MTDGLLKNNKTVLEILCYYLQMNVRLALQLLGVHRRTLSRYKIRAIRLPNRTLNYNEDDVYSMAGKSKVRMNRLARLSYDLAEKLIVQNHGRIELINAA